jgi:hypothetical protein
MVLRKKSFNGMFISPSSNNWFVFQDTHENVGAAHSDAKLKMAPEPIFLHKIFCKRFFV